MNSIVRKGGRLRDERGENQSTKGKSGANGA